MLYKIMVDSPGPHDTMQAFDACADAEASDGSEMSAWGDEPDPDAASSELSDWEGAAASPAPVGDSHTGDSSYDSPYDSSAIRLVRGRLALA